VGLNVNLLRKHVAAERNTPVQGYSRKVGTLTALHFGPCYESRDDARQSGAHKVQQAEINVDGTYTRALLGALGTKIQELDDAREVFAGSGIRDAGDVADLGGKRLLDGRGDERAAVGDEELQQGSGGQNEDKCSH